VKKEDLEALKEIWRLCFSDDDSFIEFYFQSRDWIHETAVLTVDGRIVSMLTMIPVRMVDEDGAACSASMLYAIATHPDFRRRGFADRLIGFSIQHLSSGGTEYTLLVPASKELFRYYEKLGYRNAFYVREAVLYHDDIARPAGRMGPERWLRSDRPFCRPVPAEPQRYNSIRRELLKGRAYLDYRDEEVLFQKGVASMFHADLYALEINGSEGCAYAERISEDEVMIKELLIQEQYLVSAVLALSGLLPAEKYIIRTPVYSGMVLGGEIRPFGMLRANGSGSGSAGRKLCPLNTESYLGIAYD